MSVSVNQDKKGYRLSIELPSGFKTTMRLKSVGLRSKADHNFVKAKLDALIACSTLGTTPTLEVQEWLKNIPERLYRKIQALRLVGPRTHDMLVIDAIDAFILNHEQGKTASTLKVWNRAKAHCQTFFAGHTLRSVDATAAQAFRRYLLKLPGKQGGTMAEATVRKTCGVVSMVMDQAIREGIISHNPFKLGKVPISAGRNKAREVYVTATDVLKVIQHATAQEDRCLLGLARFGGLRVPSEIIGLRWSDVDWELRAMKVISPKTAGCGKDSRLVPLFPELYDLLLQAHSSSGGGSEFILPTLRIHTNLNVRVRRLIKAAGVETYPKVMHNLRASCVTDWARKHHVSEVAAWAGHTEIVLHNHYLRNITPDHASQAALRAAQQQASDSDSTVETKALPGDVHVTVSPLVSSHQVVSGSSRSHGRNGVLGAADHHRHFVTTGDQTYASKKVDLIGLEHLAVSTEVSAQITSVVTENNDALQGLVAIPNHPHLPSLRALLAGWTALPEPARAALTAVLSLLQASASSQVRGVGE
jgi:integrase